MFSEEVLKRLYSGLEVTGYGLLGVFGVLLVFYLVVLLLRRIPEKENELDS
ncbi:MAG: hypothetical protein N2376_09965 [Clostridia bacterium]|nr:hypothetical protein [Clostridia bacterium]